MADKTIGQLVAATNVTPTDLFVLEQSGTAKKLTGQILENWLVSYADGHGGIQSIDKTSTSGFVDTYTITLADTTTTTFTVTNGRSITGITTYYAVSSSGSTVPSTWSTTRQSMTATNRYLWSYQHIAFNGGSPSTIDTVKTVIGVWGDKGDTGDTGRGIVSLAQTSREPGEYTVYRFTMSDGTYEIFYSYDGVGITSIAKTSSVGLVDLYTISYSNGTSTEFTVTNAKSITSVTQTGSSGLVDTYTIAFNDGTSTTFNVRNGSSISGIAKTSTQGLVDTYTVSLTDGTTTTFTVTNAKSITRIEQTGGTHAAGTTDTYTIYFNDGDTATFSVYNGTNGTGSVSTVDGIQPGGNQNVTLLLTGNGAPTAATPGQLYQRYFDLSTQILYICIGVDTTITPNTYSWAGTGVPVDTSLSSSSESPVQNKVITAKVGTAALNTTAQNLSGAVNELDADLAALPATVAPLMDGTAAVGTSQKLARQDHVHPHDSLITNRNLLDNWYFVKGGGTTGDYGVFPVNQRGQGSYLNSGYGIDRWYNRSAPTVAISNGGVNVSGGTGFKGIYQSVGSKEALLNKTVTITAWITALSGGTARIALGNSQYKDTIGTVIGDVSATSPGVWSATFTMPASYSQPYLNFTVSADVAVSFSIAAVKLELGDTQTLAHQKNGVWVLNEVPDYAEELAKCQAYLLPISDYTRTRTSFVIADRMDFEVPLAVPMASVPAIVGTLKVSSLGGTGQTGFTFDVGGISANSARIRATKTAHGMTDGYIASNAVWYLSAE